MIQQVGRVCHDIEKKLFTLHLLVRNIFCGFVHVQRVVVEFANLPLCQYVFTLPYRCLYYDRLQSSKAIRTST
jgi:hypothetical protein